MKSEILFLEKRMCLYRRLCDIEWLSIFSSVERIQVLVFSNCSVEFIGGRIKWRLHCCTNEKRIWQCDVEITLPRRLKWWQIFDFTPSGTARGSNDLVRNPDPISSSSGLKSGLEIFRYSHFHNAFSLLHKHERLLLSRMFMIRPAPPAFQTFSSTGPSFAKRLTSIMSLLCCKLYYITPRWFSLTLLGCTSFIPP